jgi:dTDP-4-dehydrorhamnose reductase
MRVGIIGTGWGRTHCGTFRAAGCEIAALCGRQLDEVAAIAAAEGVPHATTDPGDLEDSDIIVIASPTDTHLDYLRRFAHKPVLCEKPLLGVPPPPDVLDGLERPPKFVNYAFPFLDSVRTLDAALAEGRLGRVRRILLTVGVRFPRQKSSTGWFVDVVAHPLSWLLHRFGLFRHVGHYTGAGEAAVSVVLVGDEPQLDVALYPLPATGIRVGLDLVGERNFARLAGGYQPDRRWWFDPIVLGDERLTDGEYSRYEDIWFRANRRSVDLFCRVLEGRIQVSEAEALGAFGLRKALDMETMLAPLLAEVRGRSD